MKISESSTIWLDWIFRDKRKKNNNNMYIAVVGTGYVGLVTGACLAKLGHKVTCIDTNEEKINSLKKGLIPIYEPGLSDIVSAHLDKDLFFSTSLPDVIENISVVFIAVGTPPDENGSADLKYVLQVASEIGKTMTKPLTVVVKSTVPVGTSDKVRDEINRQIRLRKMDIEFFMVSNPEFLKEGTAIEDFMYPDRVIIGTDNAQGAFAMSNVYMFLDIDTSDKLVFTDIKSAELIKYASNSMLATRISFMNEIANLCDVLGANVDEVSKGMGLDTRIGPKFLKAGCGYGGSCFPKDVKALIKTGRECGVQMNVISAVEEANERQKKILFEKLEHELNHCFKDVTVGILGLAFKPDTDDMREATSLVLIEQLLEKGVKVNVYDPIAMEECKRRIGDKVEYFYNPYDTVNEADALILVTEWNEFRSLDFETLKKKMRGRIFIDGRNFFKRDYVESKDFKYISVGR